MKYITHCRKHWGLAMFSILFLLLPSQSSGQSRCGEFTTNDVEGPFFEVCEFLSKSRKKVLHSQTPQKTMHWPRATSSTIVTRQFYWKDRWSKKCEKIWKIAIKNQGAWLQLQRNWGSFSWGLVCRRGSRFSKKSFNRWISTIPDICQFWDTTAWSSHVKVHQKCENLQQNSGGSGDKNQLRSALKPYALPDIMSSHGYKDVVFPPSKLVTQMSSHVTLLVGYTFPGRNPVLWYRGKVNADNQGRCHSIKSFQHSRHFHHPKILPLFK